MSRTARSPHVGGHGRSLTLVAWFGKQKTLLPFHMAV
jgi:hypothetical protein